MRGPNLGDLQAFFVAEPQQISGFITDFGHEVTEMVASEREASLQSLLEASAPLDATLDRQPVWPQHPLLLDSFSAAASALRKIADDLAQTLGMVDDDLFRRYSEATPDILLSWAEQAHRLHADATALPEAPLQENWLQTAKQEKLSLSVVNGRVAALEAWRGARGVKRLFRFLWSGDAKEAVALLGFPLNDATATEALGYYRGVRTRLTLTGALDSVGQEDWLGDDALVKHWRSRDHLATAFEALHTNEPAAPWRKSICAASKERQDAVARILPGLHGMALSVVQARAAA